MRRRRFLHAAAAGCGVATAGCIAGTDRPAGVRAVEFLVLDESQQVDGAGLSVDRDRGSVEVRSQLVVGSSDCNEAVLESVEYRAGVLKLRVASGSSRSWRERVLGGGCSDDRSTDAYRARVTFEDSMPHTVVVDHASIEPGLKTERQVDCAEDED